MASICPVLPAVRIFSQTAIDELGKIPAFNTTKALQGLAEKILVNQIKPAGQANIKISNSNDSGSAEAIFSPAGKLISYQYFERINGSSKQEKHTIHIDGSYEKYSYSTKHTNPNEQAYRICQIAIPILVLFSFYIVPYLKEEIFPKK